MTRTATTHTDHHQQCDIIAPRPDTTLSTDIDPVAPNTHLLTPHQYKPTVDRLWPTPTEESQQVAPELMKLYDAVRATLDSGMRIDKWRLP